MSLASQLLFETPLIVADLDHAAAIVAELHRAAAARRAESSSDPAQPWQSDRRMLRWAGDAAIELLNSCVDLADRFTIDVDAPPGQTSYGWWADLRAEFAGAGNRIGPAFYPSAYWSAVMLAGEGSGDGALLSLEDPRMPMLHMEDPGLRVRIAPNGPSLQGGHEISLRSGQLVMFPAWLRRTIELKPETRDRALLTLNLTAFLPIGEEEQDPGESSE